MCIIKDYCGNISLKKVLLNVFWEVISLKIEIEYPSLEYVPALFIDNLNIALNIIFIGGPCHSCRGIIRCFQH